MEHELFNRPRDKKPKRQRQELKYDHKVGERITKVLRLFNYKPSDRFRSGIPDRYIAGGRWIEFKYVHHSLKRNVSTLREFSAVQRTTIEDLIAAGDRVWACIFFDTGNEILVYMAPWYEYKSDASFSPTRVAGLASWEWIDDKLREELQ